MLEEVSAVSTQKMLEARCMSIAFANKLYFDYIAHKQINKKAIHMYQNQEGYYL